MDRASMMLPNYGYGPMSQDTIAGMPNAELRSWNRGEAQTAADWWYDAVRPYVGEVTARTIQNSASNLVDFSPIPAFVAAYDDPTLGSMTNAGVHGLMSVGQPLRALKVLGAGYGAAGAHDLGVLNALAPSPAGAKREKQAGKSVAVARLPGLSDEDNASYQGIMNRLSIGDFSSGAERRALEAQAKIFTDKAGVAGTRQAELEAAKKAADQAEYDRQVRLAESTRDAALRRKSTFQDTALGELFAKSGGAMPVFGAMAGGAIMRASGDKARGLASNLVVPALEGVGGAFTASNIPLLYDAFLTPTANPEKEAFQGYARELPPGHPRKQEFLDYAAGLPDANPTRAAAQEQFVSGMPARLLMSGVEGAPAGVFGYHLPAAPQAIGSGIGRFPQSVAEGWEQGLQARNALRGAPQSGAAAPGNALPPGGGHLPPVAPVFPPVPPPPPVPQTPALRPTPYGARQQSVARPLIDSDVSVGAPVPSANALENAYLQAGVKVPTTKKYDAMLANTQQIVSEMQSRGMAGPEIARALQGMRSKGFPVLSIPAVGLGYNALAIPANNEQLPHEVWP